MSKFIQLTNKVVDGPMSISPNAIAYILPSYKMENSVKTPVGTLIQTNLAVGQSVVLEVTEPYEKVCELLEAAM